MRRLTPRLRKRAVSGQKLNRGRSMLLCVEYLNGTHGQVNGPMLTSLIESRLIAKFKRSDGWFDVDLPQVRKVDRPRNHKGSERRSHLSDAPTSSVYSDSLF